MHHPETRVVTAVLGAAVVNEPALYMEDIAAAKLGRESMERYTCPAGLF